MSLVVSLKSLDAVTQKEEWGSLGSTVRGLCWVPVRIDGFHGSPSPPPKSRKCGWEGQAEAKVGPGRPLSKFTTASPPSTRAKQHLQDWEMSMATAALPLIPGACPYQPWMHLTPCPFNGLQTAGIPGITAAGGARTLVD